MAIKVFTHRPDLSVTPELSAEISPITEEQIQDQEPNLLEMAINASSALVRFMASGFELASDEEVARRREICLACEFWSQTSNLGLGKCRKAGCGCTPIKWKLAKEKCPLKKWDLI